MSRDEIGQASLLDRLLDALVVSAVRQWALTRGDAERPRGWTPAPTRSSPRRCALLHDRPHEPWSLVSLARRVGVSRAALARRFRERVGEPPMAYLTGWRMALAADRLRARHRDGGPGRERGRLPQPVLLQQRVQAGLRPEPVGVPGIRISQSLVSPRERRPDPADATRGRGGRRAAELGGLLRARLTTGTAGRSRPGAALARERGEQWVERTLHVLRTDPGGCWVAEVDGEMIGCATSLTRELMWILSTYVVRSPACRARASAVRCWPPRCTTVAAACAGCSRRRPTRRPYGGTARPASPSTRRCT